MNFGFKFFGTVASVAVPDFFLVWKSLSKKQNRNWRLCMKISSLVPAADAEGGLKLRPLTAGVLRGLGALDDRWTSAQRGPERSGDRQPPTSSRGIYRGIACPKPEIIPIIPKMPRISNEESGTLPFPIRHPGLR